MNLVLSADHRIKFSNTAQENLKEIVEHEGILGMILQKSQAKTFELEI